MSEGDHDTYSVKQEKGNFEIVDASGKVVVSCGDQGNAWNYAVLLNEAYWRGYKAGYRQAKKG